MISYRVSLQELQAYAPKIDKELPIEHINFECTKWFDWFSLVSEEGCWTHYILNVIPQKKIAEHDLNWYLKVQGVLGKSICIWLNENTMNTLVGNYYVPENLFVKELA